MPYGTHALGDDETDERVYTTSWDFGLGEVLRGALGGRRQINRAILEYAEEFEQAAYVVGADQEEVSVETYDPVTDTGTTVEDPDDLYDVLIDDVDVEDLELRYEKDGAEVSFRYDSSVHEPFTVEVEGTDLLGPVEEELGRGMGEKGKERGLLGLLG
jgi:hypothetical protein